MYPIQGIPILSFLVKRLKVLPSDEYRLIVATTERREDDVIAVWSEQEEVPVVRGEDDDVIKRYIQCLEEYPCRSVIRVTGDNPLTCPRIIQNLAARFERFQVDYIDCQNFPYGAGADIFSVPLLYSLTEKTNKPAEREHINLYVLNHRSSMKTDTLAAQGVLARPDLRMTVDNYQDWQRICSIFLPKEEHPWRIQLEEAINRLDTSTIQ